MTTAVGSRRGPFTPVPGSGEYPRLLGGRPCLDFANTYEAVAGGGRLEFLLGYADLAGWGRHAGVLDPAAAASMRDATARDPAAAAGAFARALDLRGAIRRAFETRAAGGGPDPADLAAIGAAFAAGLGTARLVAVAGGIDWRWPEADGSPERLGWEVARCALELLRAGEPDRVRRCDGDDGACGWLFLDESRNRSRRWCSMDGCGSQAKMRRYRARGRAVAGGAGTTG